MAEKISDVIAWLQGFLYVVTPEEHEPLVGIDEDGLSLQIVGTEEYFEIGLIGDKNDQTRSNTKDAAR